MAQIVGRLRLPRLPEPPLTPEMGEMYFDTTLDTPRFKGVTQWKESGGGEGPAYVVERAMTFIESMLKPIEQPVGTSTITAAEDYAPSWTGPVAGTFVLHDGTPTVSGGNFVGYSVESHVLTDVDYLIHTQPAKADGTWSFPYAQPGAKRFVLRRDADDVMLAEHAAPFTNVRSYVVKPGQPGYGTMFARQSYMYDQAVALCAALAADRDELAQRLAQGLLNFQTTGGTNDGGFVFSARQEAPTLGDKSYRTGAHAIGVYALVRYIAAFPDDDSRDFAGAADRALDWLEAQVNPTYGLVTGGQGVYTSDEWGNQFFDPDEQLTWMSVEHNFDAYHAFKLADSVLGGYGSRAASIGNAVQSGLWDAGHGRFLQGMKGDGTPDTADPLDAHSWGAIFCVGIGNTVRAQQIMEPAMLTPYYYESTLPDGVRTKGYSALYDSPGYPGAVKNVWSEGTFGVAYAFAKMGDTEGWTTALSGMLPGQLADGGFYYVTDRDTTYELIDYEATVGAAWAALAVLGRGIWDPIGLMWQSLVLEPDWTGEAFWRREGDLIRLRGYVAFTGAPPSEGMIALEADNPGLEAARACRSTVLSPEGHGALYLNPEGLHFVPEPDDPSSLWLDGTSYYVGPLPPGLE